MVAERVKQKKEGETMASCRVSVDTAGVVLMSVVGKEGRPVEIA